MSGRGTDQARRTVDPGAAVGRGGRIALLLLLVVLLLGLNTLYGYGLYEAAVASDADAVAILPQLIAGLLALAFAPSLGLLELEWSRDGADPDGGRRRPVRVLVWLGITALAVVVHAVASRVGGVSPLVVLGFAVAAVATAAASWVLVIRAQAAAVRRMGARLADDAPTVSIDLDWTEGTARRKWRLIGLVFVLALVVTVGGTLLLDRFEPQDTAQAVALVLQFSLVAPALTCLFVSIGAQLSGSSITTGLSKEDRKAVAQRAAGKSRELEPELEWRAARLAVYSRTLQPFQLGQSAMLLVGIFVPTLLRGDIDGWLLVLFLAALVALAVTVPFAFVQHRRMSRYAATVGDLPRSHAPAPAPA
ncbi:hypothetical protein DZF92_01250 [Clavibacter michiganensis subsp. insidiosus]|nr:hypothetical protein [Clavibacter michiganensis]AWG02837.1 hypothetical protein BEH62_14685 [Clavibacter michiganensis subsp. insidiosus]OQJ58752.1 hypothetical protein B5P21_01675 [Clavibacter michiganensis subsp. insidiosus]RII88906.1 hypothetical protein DZF92_01250 [Clavibacter michiganensis subsp. insidiosus]RMC86687.1 hypothetical protein CmiCFBP2404_05555 [Clavibacter michiganensis subsp. insidiosus]